MSVPPADESGQGLIEGSVADVLAEAGVTSVGVPATMPASQATKTPGAPTYGILKQTHPTHDAPYWSECRALYEGGKALLRNPAVMRKLFPPHRDELPGIYRERVLRAFYIPYPAEIIDHLVAGVKSDPLIMSQGAEPKKGETLPDFYQEFVEDVSPDGGANVPLIEHIGDQLRTALQTCWAWTLVDLPESNPDDYSSRSEQEKSGVLRAYAVPVEPESVIDWEEDEKGDLIWAIVRTCIQVRADLFEDRSKVVDRWTYYDRAGWRRFERPRDADKEFNDNDTIPEVKSGSHSFGSVPLVRLMLPRGLWAMNKMHGIAVEHFNKRSALSWGELQSLLPELYEFQGPEGAPRGQIISEAQEDPDRSKNQRRGQGFVQQRGSGDDARFVGPDVAPFAEARLSCDGLRDDLHRVMHQMALAAANNAAALKRSAESKEQDRVAVDVVLQELGSAGRKHAEAILELVSRGRREEAMAEEWTAKGMAKFDSATVSESLKNALDVDMLRIPSPTFKKRHLMLVARDVLEGRVAQQDLEQIDKELEENITNESVAPAVPLPPSEGMAAAGGAPGARPMAPPTRGRPPAGNAAAQNERTAP